MKLQKVIKSREEDYKELGEKMNAVVQPLKGELKVWRDSCEKEIEERNKLVEEMRRMNEGEKAK